MTTDEDVDLIMNLSLYLVTYVGTGVASLGVILNILSLVVWSSKEMRSTSAFYMVSLSTFDLLYLLMYILYNVSGLIKLDWQVNNSHFVDGQDNKTRTTPTRPHVNFVLRKKRGCVCSQDEFYITYDPNLIRFYGDLALSILLKHIVDFLSVCFFFLSALISVV